MMNFAIILACSIVIDIDILVNILYAVTGHLKHGHDERFVIGGLNPGSIFVLHMLFLNMMEQIHPKGPHMSKILINKPIVFISYFNSTILSGVTSVKVIFMELSKEMIRIGHPWLL